ncbi:MAG: uridine diphosphate-N-acetylglucosamine-binding protein YvcK [Frankiaceae bacterium]|nr:uridine diphosphate-N-acetylglucosamine-binding protein YvcK [Frankiaceae bacterium]
MNRNPKVVALGGGHGLAASLQALRRVTPELTAVVTVADDGGSSGRLRDELDALPPGDLRMALAAMAGDDDWAQTWSRLLQHRFGGTGPLAGHAVGNLLLAGLAQSTGDPVVALDLVARMLGVTGRVLPMSPVPLEICAEVIGLVPGAPSEITEVVGQVAVATTPGLVAAVHLRPPNPPACKEAVRAVEEADWVVFGPGSWFTSVLPHLLVPDLSDALHRTTARRVVALNLAPQAGETEGFTPESYLDVLAAHAPELQIDVVLADESMVVDRRGLMAAAQSVGGRLVLSSMALGDGTPRHDPQRLARAYEEVFGGVAWR